MLFGTIFSACPADTSGINSCSFSCKLEQYMALLPQCSKWYNSLTSVKQLVNINFLAIHSVLLSINFQPFLVSLAYCIMWLWSLISSSHICCNYFYHWLLIFLSLPLLFGFKHLRLSYFPSGLWARWFVQGHTYDMSFFVDSSSIM